MIAFTIPLEPVSASRPKMTRSKRVYYRPKYSRFKGNAKRLMPGLMLEAGLSRPIEGECVVVIECVSTRPKQTRLAHPLPDVDNYAKAILDACNGFVWVDDKQIVALDVSKRWGDSEEVGHINVKVEEL